MEWSQTYPGLPSMVPAMRAFVRAMLADTPRIEDAELIISELGTNALRHTPSGAPGGEVRVSVITKPGWARISVTDQGTRAWERALSPPDEEEETGRGLLLVYTVADRIGQETEPDSQTMWAELTWTP